MPPTRSHPKSEAGSSTGPHDKTLRKRKPGHGPHRKSHVPREPLASPAAPGVQKLKAALRQTRRLLAKDNLAADVRVVAERKLKAQEADLAQAEQARVERAMATRYHKVKFFERQKVSRKIAQTLRALEAEDLEKKERKKLKRALEELRVDLNYIVHFPKTSKYISLFPPEARGAAPADADSAEQAKSDAQREELRASIRARMAEGELPAEPEVATELGAGKAKRENTVRAAPEPTSQPAAMEVDDFFDDAEDADEFGEEASD